MTYRTKRQNKIFQIVGIGILTALIIILQYLGGFIKFGTFSVSLVLVPIVIGASLFGKTCGIWLGFLFSVMVFITGDAAFFFSINPIGTIITVFSKGILCGFISGLLYSIIQKKNKILATFLAAAACPIINTGIFLLGCLLFFRPAIAQMSSDAGSGFATFLIVGFVGLNFLFEFIINLVLSPAIVTITKSIAKTHLNY